MSWDARVILDSVSPAGRRILTLEATYPRFLHPEVMTHRVFSRSAASNRAIPTKRIIEEIERNPVIPIAFGKNKAGMVAGPEIDNPEEALAVWLEGRDEAVKTARRLMELGLHKQHTNRVLEAYQWITTIITTTQLAHMFKLRDHKDAQPDFFYLAGLLGAALKQSTPQVRLFHLPYVSEDERDTRDLLTCTRVSTARCARISYLTRDENRPIEDEVNLYNRLLTGSDVGHMSPLEHPARAMDNPNGRSGNFLGWHQHRKDIETEYVTDAEEREFMDRMRA